MRVLVVGMPRSGTSFVGDILRQNPHVAYLFEPFGRTELAKDEFCWKTEEHVNREAADLVARVFDGQWETDPDTRQWLESHQWNPASAGNSAVIVKEIKSNLHLRWLSRILGPDLRVVHVVRDPRGIVDSFCYRPRRTVREVCSSLGGLMRFGNASRRHADESLFEHWGWNRPALKMELAPTYQVYEPLARSTDAATSVAARWAILVGHAAEDSACLPAGRYYRIHYEDLCRRPLEAASQLYRWVFSSDPPAGFAEWLHECTQNGARTDRYSTRRNSAEMAEVWRSRLSSRQATKVSRICGSIMQRAGYAPP